MWRHELFTPARFRQRGGNLERGLKDTFSRLDDRMSRDNMTVVVEASCVYHVDLPMQSSKHRDIKGEEQSTFLGHQYISYRSFSSSGSAEKLLDAFLS